MEIISTLSAPQAIGPYSQAVRAGGFIFCSGQIPLSADGDLIEGDVSTQTEQVLANLQSVLEAAGSGIHNVVKTTVFLSDMNDFAAMNDVYAKVFAKSKPARATVEVSRLPKDVLVEIECVALA